MNFSLVKELLEKEMNIDDIQLTRYPVDFFCRCCKEQFFKLLVKLGSETIIDMKEKNQRTLNCIYCNTNYNIENTDFEVLIKESIDIEANKDNEQTLVQKD